MKLRILVYCLGPEELLDVCRSTGGPSYQGQGGDIREGIQAGFRQYNGGQGQCFTVKGGGGDSTAFSNRV